MPTPKEGESKQDFLKRCIPILRDEGKPQKQSIAISINMWNQYHGENIIDIEDTLFILNEGLISDTVALGTGLVTGGPVGLAGAAAAIGTKNLIKSGTKALIGGILLNDLLNKKPENAFFQNFKKPDASTLIASDNNSSVNKITKRPQGVIICDTINNPIFPIPYPTIDDSKFNLPLVKEQYVGIYTQLSVDFLPWHYVVEMIQGKYNVFQTRPLDIRYPINTQTAKDLTSQNKITLHNDVKKYFLEQPFDLMDAIHICIIGDSTKDVYTEKIYELIGRSCVGPILRYFKMPSKAGQRVINFNLGPKFHFPKLDMYLTR